MKARKIVISSYEIEVAGSDGNLKKLPYDVKTSMSDLILAPQLKLNGTALMRNWKIAEKILNCKDEYVLLTQEEYLILKNSTEEIDVFSKNDVQLIMRINDAEQVEVDEKK